MECVRCFRAKARKQTHTVKSRNYQHLRRCYIRSPAKGKGGGSGSKSARNGSHPSNPVSRCSGMVLMSSDGRHIGRRRGRQLTNLPCNVSCFGQVPLRVNLSHIGTAVAKGNLSSFQTEPLPDFRSGCVPNLVWTPMMLSLPGLEFLVLQCDWRWKRHVTGTMHGPPVAVSGVLSARSTLSASPAIRASSCTMR